MADVLDRYVGTSHELAPPARALRHAVSAGPLPPHQRRPRGDGPLHRLRHPLRPFDLPAPRRPRPAPRAGAAGRWAPAARRWWPISRERVGPGRARRWPPTSTSSWAAGAAAPNVEILEHDVAADPPPGGPFDLVHARLVLVHVPERDAALANMVAALRPGGVLLVEDADPALQPLSCLEETGPEQVLANRLRRGFRSLLAERGRRPGLRPLAAAPAPGGRPGRRGGRRRLPGQRPGLQPPRGGDGQPRPGPAPGPRHRHRGRDRAAPGQRGRRAGSTWPSRR